MEYERVAFHAEAALAMGGPSRELDLGAAMTYAHTPRLTLVGELNARYLTSLGRLAESVRPHPSLAGVEIQRLAATDRDAVRLVASGGVKWNVASTLLLSGHLRRSLTSAGLMAGWVPMFTLEYLLGR
jgi:hypothetical protein